MENKELRLYSFINFYLSQIQQGVQTGHLAVDLLRKYTKDIGNAKPKLKHEFQMKENAKKAMVEEWADNHKTFIVLNGGPAEGIEDITSVISESDYPWVTFCEDTRSLGGIQTGVAVVLPEKIFGAKRIASTNFECGYYYEFWETDQNGNSAKHHVFREGTKEFTLIDILKSSRLA